MSSSRPVLDKVLEEARADRGPAVDWEKVEAGLFTRVAEEARARAAIERYQGKRRTWVVVGVVLAAAAAIPLFGSFPASTRGGSIHATAAAPPRSAGDLQWKDRRASVHLMRGGIAHDGAAGEAIAQGDVIEPKGGRVVFARQSPGAVSWDVEDGARVEVRSTEGSLVLALERGAVEAQVAPVANGEAFAVDVEGTRVAVHGTHLRVAREALRTTVDLREGVISIGAPPRTGSTYGDLVTAPAHVEFDASDPHGTLKVSHDPVRVRAAAVLDAPPSDAPAPASHDAVAVAAPAASKGSSRPSTSAPSTPSATGNSAAGRAVAVQSPPSEASSPPGVPAVPRTPAAAPSATARPADARSAVAPPVPSLPMPLQVDPTPQRTIANAVRACESSHVAHASGVVVTVSSTLVLRVSDTGMVSAAQFEPPLAPEVQECAVSVIYGTRFPSGGPVSIPIDFTP